jgi:hypothetical protein
MEAVKKPFFKIKLISTPIHQYSNTPELLPEANPDWLYTSLFWSEVWENKYKKGSSSP